MDDGSFYVLFSVIFESIDALVQYLHIVLQLSRNVLLSKSEISFVVFLYDRGDVHEELNFILLGGEDLFVYGFFSFSSFQVDRKVDVLEFSNVLFTLSSNCFDEVADLLL